MGSGDHLAKMRRLDGKKRFGLALLLLASSSMALGRPQLPVIAVIISHGASPYREALTGIQEAIQQRKVEAEIQVFWLGGQADQAAQAISKAKENNARLLLVLGALAAETVAQKNWGVPVVAGLVMDIRSAGRGGKENVTGVVLQHGVTTQLHWLRQILPSARTIGIIYNPAQNQHIISMARQAAGKEDLIISAHAVTSPVDLPEALRQIEKTADVLWSIPDALVSSPQTAKHLLLFSFRSRIPLVGLSQAWVKAGALYALDWDYKDIGRQCAELTAKVLHGAGPASVTPVSARKVIYYINGRTASHMRIAIPEPWLERAQYVY